MVTKKIIGKSIMIIDAKNKHNMALQGKVIDLTKKTIQIETKNGIKTLFHDQITFTIGE